MALSGFPFFMWKGDLKEVEMGWDGGITTTSAPEFGET